MKRLILKTAEIVLSLLCLHVTCVIAISHCTHPINGVKGACRLTLANFTMAGAHSAGSGAYGHLDYIPGLRTPDCRTRNQDTTFTKMLLSGVRYFELKVRHHHRVRIQDTTIIEEFEIPISFKKKRSTTTKRDLPPRAEVMGVEEGNAEKQKRDILSFVDQADSKRRKKRKREAPIASETLYLYHNGAYSKPLAYALREVDSWLGSHRNEVVVIRLSNTDDDNHDISYQVSSREIRAFKHTGLNLNWNPTLGQAVQNNMRVVLFLEQKKQIGYKDARVHHIVKLDTTTKVHRDCAETTTLYAREHVEKYNHHIIQLDWYHRLGNTCNLALARLCNSREIARLQEVNSILLRDYHHHVNVILMDFVEVGDKGNQLNDEVLKINKKNVQLCKA